LIKDLRLMMLRLIVGWLRETPQKSYTAAMAISIEAAMILTVAGIQHGLKSDPTFARLNFTLWTTVLLLIVAVVGFLFISIERYFSVLERTQQFGILRVLGAGSGYYCLLLLIEAFVICVPGTVAGICLTLLVRWGMQVTFPEFLKLDLVFTWWAIALATVAAASLIGSGIGALKAVRDGVIQALSYEK
jgi:ABC-type antimicrobial peptide transport system permease subunit